MRDIDRIQELEKILNVECPKYENDCNSCPYNEQCNEYARLNRPEYYITFDKYFGYCVKGNNKIVFTGSIEDCNAKCIELNTL